MKKTLKKHVFRFGGGVPLSRKTQALQHTPKLDKTVRIEPCRILWLYNTPPRWTARTKLKSEKLHFSGSQGGASEHGVRAGPGSLGCRCQQPSMVRQVGGGWAFVWGSGTQTCQGFSVEGVWVALCVWARLAGRLMDAEAELL